MFRYFEYQRTVIDEEIKEFVGDGSVELHTFSFGGKDRFVVSVSGETADIDAAVAAQDEAISLNELTLDAFKTEVDASDQVKRIRKVSGDLLERELAAINERYPKAEQETWGLQLDEAKAFVASGDPADAPMLKYLAEQEGDTVESFATSVLQKAEQFKMMTAAALSKKRLKERAMLAEVGI